MRFKANISSSLKSRAAYGIGRLCRPSVVVHQSVVSNNFKEEATGLYETTYDINSLSWCWEEEWFGSIHQADHHDYSVKTVKYSRTSMV